MVSNSVSILKDRLIGGTLVLALVVLVGIGLWKTSPRRAPDRIAVVRQCRAVMGTDCTLAAVVPPGEEAHAEEVLRKAEAVLHAAEARMSDWLNDSEIGRLNAAEAGQNVPLSPDTLQVLRIARQAHVQTAGAFDVTCRPLIELWREAAKRGVVPTPSELTEARARSNWGLIDLSDGGAVKRRATARVDLGGIAKGWAVDRAAEVLRRAGLSGGMVDVGGDLVCFGQPAEGGLWQVAVQDPLGPGQMARLRICGGAVCTSGGYARFTEIAGRRYSHIIDPRTGLPAEAVLSVTVVAGDATTADIWATALSVLGPDGLKRLPAGTEAMLIAATKDHPEFVCTAGFRGLLEEPLPNERSTQYSVLSTGSATKPRSQAEAAWSTWSSNPCYPTPATPSRRPWS